MKQPVGSNSSSWRSSRAVSPWRGGCRCSFFDCDDLGMTAFDVGEDDDEETLGAWSGWRKDGGALIDALMAVSGKRTAIDLAGTRAQDESC